MKKLLIISAIFLAACSSQKSQDEINKEYIAKAQKFFDSKVKEFATEENNLESIQLLGIDTIYPLSSKEEKGIRFREISAEMNIHKNRLKEWERIDGLVGNGPSEEFRAVYEDFKPVFDKYKSKFEELESANEKDTLGYVVFFKGQLNLKDGSKKKELFYQFVFDKERDINGELMDLLLKYHDEK